MPDPLGSTTCQCADLPVGPGRKVLRPDGGLGFPKWGFQPVLLLLSGSKSLWDRGLLSGAGQKAECVSVFHVGKDLKKNNLI